MKKTKHGDYEKLIKFPVWSNYKVEVIFTEDLLDSYFSRYGEAGLAGNPLTDALHTTQSGISQIFYAPTAPARVISHESWHAIFAMFKWAGVENYDDETIAYHLGWLIGEITEFQNTVFEHLKSRTKEEAPHERQNSPGALAGLQSLSAHVRRITGQKREAGEAGPTSAQADGCGDD
jgi:hypothetical protein